MLKRWCVAVGSFALVSLPALNLGCSGGGVMESDAADSSIAAATHSDANRRPRGPKLTPQQSNTVNGLISVSPVSTKVVWAAGRNGTFVKTTNGGKTWKVGVVAGAETLQFRDVQGVSERVAYLMSIPTDSNSRIYKTTDGGNTWKIQFEATDPNAFYDCFAFWGPNKGIAFADSLNGRFPVLRTLDGNTWQDIGDRLPTPLPGEAGFSSSGTCAATLGKRKAWLATGGTNTTARIFATRDRGQSWTTADVPLTVGTQSAGGAFSVGFRDARHGYAAGGDLGTTDVVDNFARSHDGGKTWKLTTRAPIGGAIYGAAYAIDKEEGWDDDNWDWDWDHHSGRGHHHGDDRDGVKVVVTAPPGTAWSNDEGDTWTTLEGLTNFWAVAFADEHTGWLVGVGGEITKIEF
jgi:photosystem II stability/assembly factor-like uncharacterized protein